MGNTPVPPMAQKDKNLAGIIFPNLVSHNKSKYSQTTKALKFRFSKLSCFEIKGYFFIFHLVFNR